MRSWIGMAPLRRPIALLIGAVLVVSGVASGCGLFEDDVTVTHDIIWGEYQGFPLGLDRYEVTDEATTTTGVSTPTGKPAILMFHGGAWAGGDKSGLATTAKGFARAGFVALSIDYALPPVGDRFPTEIESSRRAVRWVLDHAAELGVDPDRVGLYGSSAGGNLAMMVGVLGTGDASAPAIKAVAAWSGPSDLATLSSPDGKAHPDDPPPSCVGSPGCIGLVLPDVIPDYVGCTLRRCPDDYAAASPVNAVSSATPPMYLTAATEELVPFDQCRRMADALRAAGVEVEARELPGDRHAEDLRGKALAPTIGFFERHLGEAADAA